MNLRVSDPAFSRNAGRDAALGPLVPSKQALRLRCYFALAFIDVIAILAGVAAADIVRFGNVAGVEGLTLAAVLLPAFAGLAVNSGAYNAHVLASWRRGLAPTLISLNAAASAILFIAFALHASAELSRVMMLTALLVSSVLLVCFRYIFRIVARRVIGVSPLSRILIRDSVDCACPRDAFIFDADAIGVSPNINDPIMLDRLGRLLRNADSVIVACPPERRASWAMALKGIDLHGELIMPEIAEVGGIGTARFGAEATVVISSGILDLRSRVIKRAFDMTLAIAALFCLAPLMMIAAIAVRLESRGPALFVQQRLGRGNRFFSMYKFRSMRADVCDSAGNRSTSRADDRITRVGRFIRATSIDELPQLLNIVKGDMSFVGPRPHALGSLAEDLLFWEIDQRYWHRHACKPGLTGLAQVRGFRGATLQRSDLVNRLQADLEYQNGWTLWRDVSIILATFKVLVHRNAF